MIIHVIFDCAVVVTIKITITILLRRFVYFRHQFRLHYTQCGRAYVVVVVVVDDISRFCCIFLFVWPHKMNRNSNGVWWPEWTLTWWNRRQYWKRWHWLDWWRNIWQRWTFFFFWTIDGREEWIRCCNWHDWSNIFFGSHHCWTNALFGSYHHWLNTLFGCRHCRSNIFLRSHDYWVNNLFRGRHCGLHILFGWRRYWSNALFRGHHCWSNILFGSRLYRIVLWSHLIVWFWQRNFFQWHLFVFEWLSIFFQLFLICIFCTFNDCLFETLILITEIALFSLEITFSNPVKSVQNPPEFHQQCHHLSSSQLPTNSCPKMHFFLVYRREQLAYTK